jgi:DNA-binding PadR family transcriptional regulator
MMSFEPSLICLLLTSKLIVRAVLYISDHASATISYAIQAVRLTGTSYAVLSLVKLLGEATPYDLKQALERSVENFWPVPHTTFYAEPERLARGGYLSVEQEPGGRRRKLYRLTEDGRQALRVWASSAELQPPQLREEAALKVFAGGDPVVLFESRRSYHAAKLAELEGYLVGLDGVSADPGVRGSLLIGISYERQLLEAIDRFLADPQGAAAATERGAQAATGSS